MSESKNIVEETPSSNGSGKSDVSSRLKAMEEAVTRVASAVAKMAEAKNVDLGHMERLELVLNNGNGHGHTCFSPEVQRLIRDYSQLKFALATPSTTALSFSPSK